MGTVEEGLSLASVTSNNVHAHSMLGNIFLVYAELAQQGENTISVLARDKQGLLGQDHVTAFLDDTSPTLPRIAETPALTDKRIFHFSGTGEPGETIIIRGGLATVRTIVNPDGTYVLSVPLLPNAQNTLEVYAIDDSGNASDITLITITHDDTAPFIVSTSPSNGAAGIAVNDRITITFSESINPQSLNVGGASQRRSVEITSNNNQSITGNIIFSADETEITFIPAAKFLRDDVITIELSETIADYNGFTLGTPYTFSFHTALYKTTLSGVVIDPDLNPIEGISVGIISVPGIVSDSGVPGTEIEVIKSAVTSSFGTFLLDDVPPGPHILAVNLPSESQQSSKTQTDHRPPTTDNRKFPYLEFSLNIIEDTDNSLGRPIFLIPTDLSTLTSVPGTSVGENIINFSSSSANCQPPTANCLDDFSINYEPGSIRFPDGTSTGNITATRVQPAHIPDRLPDGSIPHFMVHLSAHENPKPEFRNPNESEIINLKSKITFSPHASLTFPNVYDLSPGERVQVFHFQYGLHNYTELGEAIVANDGSITTEPILHESGFIGIIPSDPDFDLTKNVLRGRVVDVNGKWHPRNFCQCHCWQHHCLHRRNRRIHHHPTRPSRLRHPNRSLNPHNPSAYSLNPFSLSVADANLPIRTHRTPTFRHHRNTGHRCQHLLPRRQHPLYQR